MKILSNVKIKSVFRNTLLLLATYALLLIVFWHFCPERAMLCSFICFLLFGVLLIGMLYRYFKEQSCIVEGAVSQIEDYISGDHSIRLECDYEGEIYKLFHEINALAAILNAHAENEKSSKCFLKDTLSNISHQLKTPLAALNVYIGIIQEEAKDTPTIQEFTALSERELERIEMLVQNLLKIAKLDAGTIFLEKIEENVADMMGDVERQFAYRAKQEEKNMVFVGEENVTLFCDCIWLKEAIGNLVKNAFDHTQKGDFIRVEWKKFASVVQIKISDNGSGIHPEDLYHIFKRFYRSRFSKDTQGVGLGLPLAKTIVEAHGGTIEVDSELGTGSTFTINFLIPTKL